VSELPVAHRQIEAGLGGGGVVPPLQVLRRRESACGVQIRQLQVDAAVALGLRGGRPLLQGQPAFEADERRRFREVAARVGVGESMEGRLGEEARAGGELQRRSTASRR
jgi:hypothetical protein